MRSSKHCKIISNTPFFPRDIFSYAASPSHPTPSKNPPPPPTHPSNYWHDPQSHSPSSETSTKAPTSAPYSPSPHPSPQPNSPQTTNPSYPPPPAHTDKAPTRASKIHRNAHTAPSNPPS